ncbi:peptidase S41-like protein [Spirosoma oryzae]|uniref:Peptidase S41-like protein n=2 Tax=Spirosoma oryzae TaxID=1469603 RepID=A0A2T0TF14_9BACT|nr:peptidase S41-like protein [Spirosoma oryzae]
MALLSPLWGIGQPTLISVTQPIPQHQLLADFDTFRRIYQTANSGLYRYRSKKNIDSVFAANRKQIRPGATVLDLYQRLYAVTDYTGSLHSDNYLPARIDSLLKSEVSFFPHPVKIIDGALLINTTHGTLPVGSRLLAINGQHVSDVLGRLGKYATTDGYNKTGKSFLISQHFAWYYRLDYGPCSTYDLTYLAPGRTDTSRCRIPAVAYSNCQKAFAQRYSLPLEKDLPAYELTLIDSLATACVTVRTFDLDHKQEKEYRRFLDSTFRLLNRRPDIRSLIVDVRQNSGGNDPNDLLLYSYLARQRFRENKRAYTIFRNVPLPAYFVEETAGERQELADELRTEHYARARQGKYYLRTKENPRWLPNPNRFRGKLVLLIGPQTASAGSLFASLVRSDPEAVVIGEETMGGYYGHTGHESVAYRLPYTQIRVKFSIIDLDQDVRVLPFIPRGRGVFPDYTIKETKESFLRNHDTVLDFTLQLIKTAPGLPKR